LNINFYTSYKKNTLLKVVFFLSLLGTFAKAFPGFEYLFVLTPLGFLIIIFAGLISVYNDLNVILNDISKFNLSRIAKSILYLVLLFPVWSVLTSIWSLHPHITLLRSFYLLFLIIGTYFASLFWNKISDTYFGCLIPLNIIVLIASIISLLFDIPQNAWTGGNSKGFMGFVSHQNTLGAIVLFTSPSIFEQILKYYFNYKSKKNIYNKYLLIFYSFILAANLYLLIITHSRASILSFFIMCIILALLINYKYFFITAAMIIISLISLSVFNPGFKNSAESWMAKGSGSILGSRLTYWESSFEAAISGGFTGLGYGISNPAIKNDAAGNHYDNGIFVREKLNSFLALIEETGIIGLILFLLPCIFLFYYFLSERKIKGNKKGTNHHLNKNIIQQHIISNNIYNLPFAFLIALIVNAQFEAWFVGVGSFQFLIYIFLLFISFEKMKNRIID